MKTDQKILIIECRAASSELGQERMLSQRSSLERTHIIPKPVGIRRKLTLESISRLNTWNLYANELVIFQYSPFHIIHIALWGLQHYILKRKILLGVGTKTY